MALDEFLQRVNVAGVASALVTDLAQLAGIVHRFYHGAGSLDMVGHHFLAIDIFASLEGHDCVGRVPEVRGGDDDGIEILFLLEHISSIDVAVRGVSKAGFDAAVGTSHAIFHDVADCRVVEARDINHRVEQDFVLLAAADEAHIDHVRRGLGAADRLEDRRRAQDETRAGEGSFAEEVTPGQAGRMRGDYSFHLPVISSLLCFDWKSMRAIRAIWMANQATPEFSLIRMRPTVRLV